MLATIKYLEINLLLLKYKHAQVNEIPVTYNEWYYSSTTDACKNNTIHEKR